ncbi:MAG TPA: glycosyltransferase family 4 protein [Steroidobacter sp.]|nr:glycosyltransferase family 4 protein [Steroidobacteraceae bacterium]HLS80578.1 glycosyltransferase family 4 protein [Steroidobacter sp.]
MNEQDADRSRSTSSASPFDEPSRRCATAARRGRAIEVLMLGPDLAVRGGVASVERLMLRAAPADLHLMHVPTMVEGGPVRKTCVFVNALCRSVNALRRRPDLVHLHFASRASSVRKEILARIALARGVKVVMHAHGAEYRMYWEEMSPAARSRTLAVLRRVSALIVLGDSWREFFIGIGVPAGCIAVMPNPVRLPVNAPARLSARLVTCVYLGVISNRKGAFDLIDALRLLPTHCRERLRLVVAGNGKGEQLRARVSQHGLAHIVQVHDWLAPEQRDALLASAHVFALPSYNEGLPMALLEAMAFGVAPIVTPVGSIAEVVKDGLNGLLVQPGDPRALATALQRMLEHPDERARMAARARQTVEPLGLETYMQRLTSLYRTVCDGGLPAERG